MGTMVNNVKKGTPDVTIQRHTVVHPNAGPWSTPVVSHHDVLTDHTQAPSKVSRIIKSSGPNVLSPYHPLAYPPLASPLTRGLIKGGTVITTSNA